MPEAPASHYETGTWHHCASTSPDGGELSARRRWAVKAHRHYEAPRAAADRGTRLGGAESKRRRRSRLPAAALPAPVLRLVESGDYLVHAARLPAPVALRLAARLETDEDLRVELAPADYARWRDAVARALAAAGVPVEAG